MNTAPFQPGDRVRFTVKQRVPDSFRDEPVDYEGVVTSSSDDGVRVKLDKNGNEFTLAAAVLEKMPS